MFIASPFFLRSNNRIFSRKITLFGRDCVSVLFDNEDEW
jgi:hypothetical protein